MATELGTQDAATTVAHDGNYYMATVCVREGETSIWTGRRRAEVEAGNADTALLGYYYSSTASTGPHRRERTPVDGGG